MATNLLSDVIDDYRKRALLAAFSFKDLVYRLFAFLLTTSFILWLSVFLYVSFYYSYVPAISHIRPVHLEFSACKENVGLCSYPSANITLTQNKQLLQSNQPYKIILDLDLPESDTNKQIGMFMVQVELTGRNGKFIAQSRRIAMLRYKSWILHSISTLIFSPALLAGPMEEKQELKVEMFSEFLELVENPVTNIRVEIESRHVQLYSAKLRIQAEFTGLRYFMFYWPMVSATIGIATNVIILSFLVGYVWYRILNPNQVVVRVGVGLNRNTTSSVLNTSSSSSPIMGITQPMVATVEPQQTSDAAKTMEQRRMEAREILIKERQRKMSSPNRLTPRMRSTSVTLPPREFRQPYSSSPERIQELSPSTSTSIPSDEKDLDEGLVMVARETITPELRHRTSSLSTKEDNSLKDSL